MRAKRSSCTSWCLKSSCLDPVKLSSRSPLAPISRCRFSQVKLVARTSRWRSAPPPPVEQKRRIEEQPVGAGVVANNAQGILPRFQHHLGVLVGSAEDQVRPLLDRVSPQLSDLGSMKNRTPISQSKHQGLNRSSQHFIDRGLKLLLLHGGFATCRWLDGERRYRT